MAEKPEELELPKGDAGWGFRAEMAATNFLLGYWRHMIAIVVVSLLAVLVWGQYRNWRQGQQRQISAQIADAERDLPDALPELPDKVSAGDVKPDALVAPADQISAIAEHATGAARMEGYLKAAELYRMGGKPDRQRACLEAAAAADRKDVLGYAAEAGLANLDLQEEKTDEAIARFTKLKDTFPGILGQSAALDLGLSLEHLGRKDEARRVYDDFVQKWPDSPHTDQVQARREALSPPAEPAAPAPAPGGAG